MDFRPKTDRICSLQLKGILFNTTISVHGPTEEKDKMQKDAFYEDLGRTYMKAPRYDIKVVMGDFNAKVGKEPGLMPNVENTASMKKQIIMGGE